MRYQVQVEGLIIAGHPHLELFSNLAVASNVFDKLCDEHLYKTVILSECRLVELRVRKKLSRPFPKSCPQGHEGEIDGQTIIKKSNIEGRFVCRICGTIWEIS